jgi:hypothetical protein
MAVTNFSPLLGLALPTTGDLSGTWGTTVNDSITQLIDSAVAGTTTLSADTDVTLSTTNGAANQARNAVLRCTGARTTLKTITAPAQSKAYIVINDTTGGFGVKVVGAGPTTGVTIANGEKALIAWNGSDFVIVSSSVIDLTTEVTGVLPVANGGTGNTTAQAEMNRVAQAVTSGQYLRGNGTNVVMSAIQVADVPTLNQNTTGTAANVTGVVAVVNGGTGVTTSTGTGSTVLSASPALTGIPTVPTASNGTNTTQAASTAFVINSIGAITAGVSTFSAGTTGLTPSTATNGAVTLAGTLGTANGGTGNANGTVAKLATTNFSVEESGGVLVFKYGATTIASMTSAGVFTTLSDITGNGTP